MPQRNDIADLSPARLLVLIFIVSSATMLFWNVAGHILLGAAQP